MEIKIISLLLIPYMHRNPCVSYLFEQNVIYCIEKICEYWELIKTCIIFTNVQLWNEEKIKEKETAYQTQMWNALNHAYLSTMGQVFGMHNDAFNDCVAFSQISFGKRCPQNGNFLKFSWCIYNLGTVL